VTVSDKLKKLDVLADWMQVRWLDGRDVALVTSVQRDLRRIST
jgi:hypothetical protein